MTILKSTALDRATAVAALGAALAVAAPALADDATPDSASGRYMFNKTADGVVRLDTKSGEVALCSQRTVGWACTAAPEDRAVLEDEIARLRAENAALKKDILARGLPLPPGANPVPSPEQPSAQNKTSQNSITVPLPSDADIDRVTGFANRVWHRFKDMVERAQQQIFSKQLTREACGLSKLSAVKTTPRRDVATAVLTIETSGEGFFEISRDVEAFLEVRKARDGALLLYLRHTSASLVIQENADADVRTDLVTALNRLAPAQAGYVHEVEGPDDMPAHIKSMINGVSLQVPVSGRRNWRSAPGRASMLPSIAPIRIGARWSYSSSAAAARAIINDRLSSFMRAAHCWHDGDRPWCGGPHPA